MNNERFTMRINGLSILMMLILLCITVFAVLTLVSSVSQDRLSEKYASYVSGSAEADADAQRRIASLSSDYLSIPADENGFRDVTFETPAYGGIKIVVTLVITPTGETVITQYETKNTALPPVGGE